MLSTSRVTMRSCISLTARSFNVNVNANARTSSSSSSSYSSSSSLVSKLPSTRTTASFSSLSSVSSSSSSSSASSSSSWRKWVGVVGAGVLVQAAYNKTTAEADSPSADDQDSVSSEVLIFNTLLEACQSDPTKCAAEAKKAVSAAHEVTGDSEAYAAFLLVTGLLLHDVSPTNEAEITALLKSADKASLSLYGEKDHRSMLGQFYIGKFLIIDGKVKEGTEVLKKLHARFVDIFGPDHENTKALADRIQEIDQ